jgi:hypothetical protein
MKGMILRKFDALDCACLERKDETIAVQCFTAEEVAMVVGSDLVGVDRYGERREAHGRLLSKVKACNNTALATPHSTSCRCSITEQGSECATRRWTIC